MARRIRWSPLQLGEDTHQLLDATQYSVEWHTYPMPHSVCQQEIADIAEWLRRVVLGIRRHRR